MPRWSCILALICSGILGSEYCRAEESLKADQSVAKPNVVFILADDFGYGDLGCYGHPYARTPAIDGLSKDGTRFTQFYATGVTCCPSRTGFMTSKFPATFHDYPADYGFGSRVTISELLKKNGYRTGHFGKWHMGPVDSAGTYRFDATPSSPGSEAGKIRARQDPCGRDASIFDQAISFIEKNKDQPFYVNVWAHSTHMPVDPPQALTEEWKDLVVSEDDFPRSMREKFQNCRDRGGDVNQAMKCYLAEVAGLDRNVCRLLQTLDDLGLRDNTIVVFSSDQGPAPIRTAEEEDNQAKEPKAKKAGKTGGAGKSARSITQLNMMGSAGELYDIPADPAEENNVAGQEPDLVRTLAAKIDAWTATLPVEYAKTKDTND